MESVTCVLVMDGFTVDGVFWPKEAAFCWGKSVWSQFFSFPIRFRDLSEKDRRSAIWATRWLYKLRFDFEAPDSRPLRDLEDVVRSWYELYGKGGVVGFKGNHHIQELLDEMGIPCLDLGVHGCPKATGHLCASARALQLMSWVSIGYDNGNVLR